MTRKIWLINLFGTPCAPSSFCPDNSLASLAASLFAEGYSPLILDYQTIDFCSKLIPETVGKSFAKIVDALREGKEEENLQIKIKNLHDQLGVHQDKLLDEIVGEFEERWMREKPLFIGFKLYSGEGHHLVTELVNKLKHRNWPTKIIGGGPLLRVVGKDYFHCYDGFDFLLDGEAERSIVKFASFLEGQNSIQDIPGLIYRHDGKIHTNPPDYIEDLDSLPAPLYDKDVYPALYDKNQKAFVFQIDDSRGCPNKCSFCVHPSMNGNFVRCRRARNIVAQMADLQEKFGAYCFRFTGSNTPKKLLREVTGEILRMNLNVRYSCYASINMTSIDEIKNFKKAGLAGLFIGVETLDEHVLQNVFRKKQDTKDAKQLVTDSLAEGIYTTTSWIYPAPHQTKEARKAIIEFLTEAYRGKTSDEGSIMIIPPAIVPNTDWFNSPQNFGFEISSRPELIKSYARLRFNLHIPRRLIGDLAFNINGRSFFDLQDECDHLQRELGEHNLPLNITDDWMLMGKLSGHEVSEFKRISSQSLITGDYSGMAKLISAINSNSKRKLWATGTKKKAA